MRKRITSLLLTLVMLLSLVPFTAVTANAADGFVEVSTYEQLRNEVNKGSAKVKLVADIDTTSENSGVGVTTATNLRFKGNGNVLDLNGHELKLVSNMSAYFIEILSSDLTIKDSGTNGRIEFIYGDSVVGIQRAIVISRSVGVKKAGSLTVDGGTLSSSYHGIILIESYGSITINGGRLYAPVSDLGNGDYLIHSTNRYDIDDTLQLHVNGGELDGRVVLKRDDSSATGTLKYKVTPIKITGGTFKQGLYATWKTWDSPEGEPKNAVMTMDSPTVEITGGVFEKNNEEYSQTASRLFIDLPTKLRGGTFKNGATIRFVGGKYTWDGTQPQYRASIGNSAILHGNDIRTAYGWSKSDWFEIQDPWIYLSPRGTSVTVIPNAWGMKSVTLDGTEINYAKDWKGAVEKMDNSTAHTLKFEWKDLAQELIDAGYTYQTKCEHYISGSTAVQQTDTIAADKTSHTITIPAGVDPKVYSYDLQLNLQKDGSFVGIMSNEHIVKLVVSEAPVVVPDPTIVGTVYYTSGIVYGSPISIAASVTPAEATPAYQWQRSTDGGSTWTNIEGATSGKYTPVAADMGDTVRIRVKVTAEGYLGEIVGAALKVSKAANDDTPTWPDVVAQKDGDAYKKFEITNYNPKQEYVYTTSPISGSEWPDGGTKITSATVEELDTGSTYYIYTRYKETDTHTAGSKIRSSSVLVDEINKLNRIILTDESGKVYSSYGSGNTIYIKKGESMTLTAKTNPDGANTWSDFTFKSQYDASAPFSVTAPAASVTSGSTIPSVTIYGNEAGTGTLAAEYPGYPAAQSYGTWRVHVYENVSDIGTGAEITVSPSFPDMTMYQGETMPLPEYTVTVYPEGALDNYDLAWRIIKVGAYGPSYKTSDDNITLENGKIEATKKHTGSENTRIALVAINKGNNYISSLSSFYVTVTAAPVIELTGLTVAPAKVNLELNATYQLSAVKEPVNAEGSLNWTSDKPDIVAVSSTGEVTAKAQGTAIITVTCGTKSASCTVTVGHTHNTEAQPWVYMDPGTHIKTCTAGDDFKVEAHDFNAWTPNGDDTTHSRTCSKCKKSGETANYTETANHNWQWVVDTAATPNAAGKQHEECVDCHAKHSENTEIPMLTSIKVEHLTVAKPVKDAAATAPTTTDSAYTVANTEWMAADGTPLAIGGKFQPGTVYTVKITLETAGAGVFSVKSTYNTIEGKTATVSPNLTGDNHADSVILTYTFDATEGTYVPTKPAITTVALPDGKVGDAYNQTLAATGTNPITWGIEAGTLPDGLTLVGDTIKGTPSKAGDFKFTVKATNGGGSDTKELTIKIADADSAKYHNVTLSGAGTGATGAGSHAAGTTVNIYAGTKSGYTFNGWTSDDVTVLSASSKNASFVMPDKDVTVKANWVYNGGGSTGGGYTYYTIKATAGVNGSISPTGNVSVREGRDQTFTITPDKGYAVAKVLIDSKNVGAVKSYTFENVKKNHTIEVVFMKASGNPQTGVFVDVPEGSYYEEAVNWAVEKGITTGTDATHFSPNGICTRAQAVTFLWRAAGSPAAKSAVMPFTDVKAGNYYYDAVLWAVENGITKGTSDTMFSPDATCSRAQIVTFLWRSQKSPAAGTANPFTDVKASAYYADAVLWAVKEDVTKGTTNTTFSPDANCTRAQIVTFIWRALAE